LNNDDESSWKSLLRSQERQRQDIIDKVRTLEEKAISETTNLNERLAAWQKDFVDAPRSWTVLEPKDWQNFATKFEKQDDMSLLGGGDLEPGRRDARLGGVGTQRILPRFVSRLSPIPIDVWRAGPVGQGKFYRARVHCRGQRLNNPTVTTESNSAVPWLTPKAPGFFRLPRPSTATSRRGGGHPQQLPITATRITAQFLSAMNRFGSLAERDSRCGDRELLRVSTRPSRRRVDGLGNREAGRFGVSQGNGGI